MKKIRTFFYTIKQGFVNLFRNKWYSLASISYGKGYIHGVGDPAHFWDREQDAFLESMADAAKSVVEYFKGNAVYINVMKNMSVDCDCCDVAEDPCIADIGILISEDPVAIDQACVDLV